jgi:hypothetical protein
MTMRAFVAAALVFSATTASPAGSPDHAESPRRFSERDLASVSAIARKYPCAMLSLLHVMQEETRSGSGVLYVDEIPTPARLQAILDELHSGTAAALTQQRTGQPLVPRHLLESAVTVVASPDEIRLTPPYETDSSLPIGARQGT